MLKKKWKHPLALLLSAAVVISQPGGPVYGTARGEKAAGGLCEHHTEHNEGCGYKEGTPCGHEHRDNVGEVDQEAGLGRGGDCYVWVENCLHVHTDQCFPKADDLLGGSEATSSNADKTQPTECGHVCSKDTGCITKKLDCKHEHDETCGYVPATEGLPCGYECEVCQGTDSGIANCICAVLCSEDSINSDCPACGIKEADLSLCNGEVENMFRSAVLFTTNTTDNGKAIQFGTNAISDPEETDTGSNKKHYIPNSYVYFGVNGTQDKPIKWRVLDADKANDSQTDGMFLLSEYFLDGNVKFLQSASSQKVEWAGSNAQEWCNDFAANYNNFSSTEQSAMLGVAKTETAGTWCSKQWKENSLTANDKLFFLSAAELASYVGNYAGAPGWRAESEEGTSGMWWLRSSPQSYDYNYAGAINFTGGSIEPFISVSLPEAARPVFNLDLNSILFTSAAEGGKDGTGLMTVDDYSDSEWKLTLLDEDRNFAVTETTTAGQSGGTITLNYSGATVYDATTAPNEYISVIIADNSGALYYGRLLQPTSENGTVSLEIPDTLADGIYTLYVFSEQYNGGTDDNTKLTDYASAFDAVTLTVGADTTAPTLTAGTAIRDSETAATVKFTSNEAGSYYYAVIESGAAVPTIDTTGTGASYDTTVQTITLDSLSGTGAKDIYIVVKDAAGNVSSPLKVEIPAYVSPVSPTYAISANTTTLNFGSATEGCTIAPVVQTITITNTGNQQITLTQPTATNYEIGMLSKTTLAENETATFTVQPKGSLGVGTYNETITVQGANGGNTTNTVSIAANYEVISGEMPPQPTTYTITVSADPTAGGAVTGGGTYNKDASVTVTATANDDYKFVKWTENGSEVSTSASYTFTAAANRNLVAVFEKNSGGDDGGDDDGSTTTYYTLTFDTNGGSKIDTFRTSSYGENVDLTAYTPIRQGYDFNGWYSDAALTDKIISIRINGSKTVYAGWTKRTETTDPDGDKDDTEPGDGKEDTTPDNGRDDTDTDSGKDNPSTGEDSLFADVKESDGFYPYMMYVYEKGLMAGTSSTTFSPNSNIVRAMIAAILCRMDGSPKTEGKNSFTDVPYEPGTAWYYDAVTWAQQNGIVTGYEDGTFRPNDAITREQLMVFFYNYAKYKGYNTSTAGDLSVFTDAGEVSPWAREAFEWAVGSGILNDRENNLLDPKGTVTRAQAAIILYNFLEKYKPSEETGKEPGAGSHLGR